VIGTIPFLAIMASALLHAVWNAMARSHKEPGDIIACSVMAAGVICIPLLMLVGLPSREVWPWLVGGVIINSIGIRAAMAAYIRTSYGLAYPIMRAGIPLLALPIAILMFDEWPTPGADPAGPDRVACGQGRVVGRWLCPLCCAVRCGLRGCRCNGRAPHLQCRKLCLHDRDRQCADAGAHGAH
jgi:hypothetical protein